MNNAYDRWLTTPPEEAGYRLSEQETALSLAIAEAGIPITVWTGDEGQMIVVCPDTEQYINVYPDPEENDWFVLEYEKDSYAVRTDEVVRELHYLLFPQDGGEQ